MDNNELKLESEKIGEKSLEEIISLLFVTAGAAALGNIFDIANRIRRSLWSYGWRDNGFFYLHDKTFI